MMHHIMSPRPMLDAFSDSNLMRESMGRAVQIAAFVVGFALIAIWGGLWTMINSVGGLGALALTVTQIVLLAAFVRIVQVIYARGEDIRNLPESDFAHMAIFASLVRLPGEALVVFYALFSVPAMLLTWAGAGSIAALFGVPIIDAHPFLAGLTAMVACGLMGFASLVVCSLLAEMVTALFTIAHDLRSTRHSLEGNATAAVISHHARAA